MAQRCGWLLALLQRLLHRCDNEGPRARGPGLHLLCWHLLRPGHKRHGQRRRAPLQLRNDGLLNLGQKCWLTLRLDL